MRAASISMRHLCKVHKLQAALVSAKFRERLFLPSDWLHVGSARAQLLLGAHRRRPLQHQRKVVPLLWPYDLQTQRRAPLRVAVVLLPAACQQHSHVEHHSAQILIAEFRVWTTWQPANPPHLHR